MDEKQYKDLCKKAAEIIGFEVVVMMAESGTLTRRLTGAENQISVQLGIILFIYFMMM